MRSWVGIEVGKVIKDVTCVVMSVRVSVMCCGSVRVSVMCCGSVRVSVMCCGSVQHIVTVELTFF